MTNPSQNITSLSGMLDDSVSHSRVMLFQDIQKLSQ